MKPLPVKEPTLLQTTRCDSCTTYIDGICHNKDETVHSRKFKPGNTCGWHSSNNGHLGKTRGGVYDKASFKKADIDEVEDMFLLDGKDTTQIAKEMGVTYSRIYNYTKRLSRVAVKEAVAC